MEIRTLHQTHSPVYRKCSCSMIAVSIALEKRKSYRRNATPSKSSIWRKTISRTGMRCVELSTWPRTLTPLDMMFIHSYERRRLRHISFAHCQVEMPLTQFSLLHTLKIDEKNTTLQFSLFFFAFLALGSNFVRASEMLFNCAFARLQRCLSLLFCRVRTVNYDITKLISNWTLSNAFLRYLEFYRKCHASNSSISAWISWWCQSRNLHPVRSTIFDRLCSTIQSSAGTVSRNF